MNGGEPQSQRAARQLGSRTRRELLSFGGVSFELLGDRSADMPLAPELARFCGSANDPDAIAHATCSIRVDPALAGEGERRPDAIQFTPSRVSGQVLVESHVLHAQVTATGPRRYAVVAAVAPGAQGLEALLRGVAAAIVHLEGGLVLHAAAVELHGSAVLFVGPSCAGKSTAAELTSAARTFAHDHAAIVRSARGLVAWGLPGGTPSAAPSAPRVAYPLAAILRVRQGAPGGEPRAQRLRGADALFALRESVEWADPSPAGEDVYLRAVTELSSAILVGSIETVLGRDAARCVLGLLAGRPGESAREPAS